MTTPILLASNLHFNYDDRTVFDGLSASIPAGISLVRGGDGRGKSTLLNLFAGLLSPQGGVLQVDGVRLDEQSDVYRRKIFYVDPRTDAYDEMTPPEFFAAMQKRFLQLDESRLPALIDGLSLTPHLEKKLFMLSTGSKRKVYLAAAFASGAVLVLLDDPYAGLDRASINFVVATLNDIAVKGTQAVVVAMYEAPADVVLVERVELGD